MPLSGRPIRMRPLKNLIVGCGDIGLRLAARLQQAGEPVTGVVRSPSSAARLRAQRIDALTLDLDHQAPADAEQVYWLAPPPSTGDRDPRLQRWLHGLAASPRKIVYLSTSGVYGDCEGRWIDEDEPLKPQTDRGRRRLDAERMLAALPANGSSRYCVLRVPGIYGPGRLPVERLRRGLPVVRDVDDPAQRRWTNRIHAEDLADAVLAAMQRGKHAAAYNASDGHPSTMSDYFGRCARLLGLPEPPQVSLDEARSALSPALLSFLEESKRLRNNRMLEDLHVQLRYPDIASGLPSCLA